MKKITLLGSTGSIGASTCDLVALHPDRFQIVGLVAGKNLSVLAGQIKKFSPEFVAVQDAEGVQKLRRLCPDFRGEVCWGEEGAMHVARSAPATLVISAIVGAAGLKPTLAAIEAGKDIALANKESMVIAGQFMNAAAKRHGANIFPVDSEHSALFQCLQGNPREAVARLILTASGGPFRTRAQEELAHVTLQEALKHPNWDMGAKITIDSATMMNKGLEVMEARWLFDVGVDQIAVLVHPQSIIHSLVEYQDGSVMAQLGTPDMKVPIAYALAYPERIVTNVQRLSLAKIGELTFFEPDFDKFPCLKLAFEAARIEQTAPAVLNAANEVAVAAFLGERIRWIDISQVVAAVLATSHFRPIGSLEDVVAADQEARRLAGELVQKFSLH